MKKQLLALLLVPVLLISGCSSYQKAQTAYNVVEGILNVAKAELPALPLAPGEVVVVSGYIGLAGELNDQYLACINNAQNTMIPTKGKFLDCLGIFAAGLNDPKELAQLRVLSPTAQHRAQIVATALTVGVNATIVALGGQGSNPPVIGNPPTAAELQEFKEKVFNGR